MRGNKVGFSRRNFLKLGSVGLAGISLFGAAGCSSGNGNQSDSARTMSWVSFQPASHPSIEIVEKYFWTPIRDASGGELNFERRGGPETMAPSDMGLAVQRGAVDAMMIFTGAYQGVVPGVDGWKLSEVTTDKERDNGAVDLFDELHQQNNLKYLGRVQPQEENFFYTWLSSQKLETQEDFESVLIGSDAGARAAVLGWGSNVEEVPVPDNYSALEQGLVEGLAGQPLEGAISNGWYELVDYVVDIPYYQSTVVLVMNKDVYDELTDEQQQFIREGMVSGEREVILAREEELAEARSTIERAGIEFYKPAPDVQEWYLTSATEAAWESQMQAYPEVSAELRELITRQ